MHNVCVIGKFKEFSCRHERFLDELRTFVGQEGFPWKDRDHLFRPATTEIPYFFDESMLRISTGYQATGNRDCLRSLMGVSYNYDTFSAADGLYAKVVLRVPGEEHRSFEGSETIEKAFRAIHNHKPMQEGEKVTLNLIREALGVGPTIPGALGNLWAKLIVDSRARITHHILLGPKGHRKKVHIFSRPAEPATFENTPEHLPARVLPFRQLSGVIVRDGCTYSYHIDPYSTRPSSQGSQN